MGIKRLRGGKYSASLEGSGYYGRNTAGDERDFMPKDYGTKREFIGSGTKEYNFYKRGVGILTIRADSYEDALRLAKRRGYSSRNYMR